MQRRNVSQAMPVPLPVTVLVQVAMIMRAQVAWGNACAWEASYATRDRMSIMSGDSHNTSKFLQCLSWDSGTSFRRAAQQAPVQGGDTTARRLTPFIVYEVLLLGLEVPNLSIQIFDVGPEVGLLLQLALAAALRAEAVGLHALVAPAGAALILLAEVIRLRSTMRDSASYTIPSA